MKPKKSQPNDDPDLDPNELEDAEFATPEDYKAPEVSEETAELTAWDEAPGSAGSTAPKVRPDDDVPPAEQLVEEGVEEADREQRIAASDPDYEP